MQASMLVSKQCAFHLLYYLIYSHKCRRWIKNIHIFVYLDLSTIRYRNSLIVIGWHLRVQIKFHLSSVCRVAKSNSSSNFQSYMLTCLPIPTLEFLFVLLMRFELTRPNGQGIFLPHLLLYKHT